MGAAQAPAPVVIEARPHRGAGARPARLAIAAGLAAVVLAVYSPVGHFPFLNLDDNEYVTDNAFVNTGISAANVEWALTAFHSGHWHPLTWLSLMSDCHWFGVDAGALHLVNAGMFAVSAALLFLALAEATGNRWRSAFVAALFALHPLRVESVAWVAARKDVLSGLFLMILLWAYARYSRRETARGYALVLLAFALGLLAKPTLAIVPFGLLLLDYWPLRRVDVAEAVEPAAASPSRAQRSPWWLLAEKIPLFVLAVATLSRTWAAQQAAGAVMDGEGLTLPVRIANALWNYVLYLGRTAWPFDLAVFYPLVPTPVANSVAAALVLAVVTLVAVRERTRRPWLLVGWLWFAGTLVPVSGLIQFGGQAMADRYSYIPHIGLFLAVTWEIAERLSRRKLPHAVTAALAAVVLAGCAAATSSQLRYWSDSITLFERSLEVTTGNYFVHNNLGVSLEAAGRREEAAHHYAEAVRINPGWPEAQNNFGIANAWRGDYAAAAGHFREALRVRPNFAKAENNLATALSLQGDVDAALAHYLRAVELDPLYVDARYALADLLERRGQLDKAEEHYAFVVAQRPEWTPAFERLQRVRSAKGASGGRR